MTEQPLYTKYRFSGFSGYLVAPPKSAHSLLSIRHTASVRPWSDADAHLHSVSEEYYLLLQGVLRFLVANEVYTLYPREILAVRPGVTHAVLGGEGLIQHFGFRVPAKADRESIPADLAQIGNPEEAGRRDMARAWGFRASLNERENCNCWLIGKGEAKHRSHGFSFAFLDFPTQDQATAGIGTHLRMHLHAKSWEYYICLSGSKTLQIGKEKVEVHAGEMVEVHPGARHNVIGRYAPYVGATFRVPVLDDEVEC